MVIKQFNVSLTKFEDRDIDGYKLSANSAKDLVQKASKQNLPVVLRVGAIDYKLGTISRIRVGRDEAFADVMLEIKADLEFESVKDEDGKVIGVKPSKFVYKKE